MEVQFDVTCSVGSRLLGVVWYDFVATFSELTSILCVCVCVCHQSICVAMLSLEILPQSRSTFKCVSLMFMKTLQSSTYLSPPLQPLLLLLNVNE